MIWLKELAIGFVASLISMMVMIALIRLDLAPYTTPPPLALTAALHLQPWPLQGILVHYVWGMAWAVVFLMVFRRHLTRRNGLWLGACMWLGTVSVLAALTGWGMFGIFAGQYDRMPDDPLYLRSMTGFLTVSLLVNLLHGVTVAWLSRRFLRFEVRRMGRSRRSHIRSHSLAR
jgi:uncharacterized membrane protein